MQGYVYVWGGDGIYKIGRAKDPQKRVKAFPVMPYLCDFAHIIGSEDCILLERRLHSHFSSNHVRGEWYRLAQEELEAIPGIANPPAIKPGAAPAFPVAKFTFRRYLDDLTRAEKRRPEGARPIPTMEEIAEAVDIHPVSFSRIVNNNVKRLNLDTVGRVIAFMRARGFGMQTTDFIDFDDLNLVNN